MWQAGVHHEKGTTRIGVELDEPNGKSGGKFAGRSYFKCAKGHAVLVPPAKVTPEQPNQKGNQKQRKPGASSKKRARKAQHPKAPAALAGHDAAAGDDEEEVKGFGFGD